MSQFKLLSEKRFKPFFFTQFLGAFNDNVFKTALISLIAFSASGMSSISSGMLATILPGVFILPFVLLSATAGQLADKFEKSKLIRVIKLLEIGIMSLASVGFYLNSLVLLTISLFLMGTHSTLFGPVKYSYLPQHLSEKELIGGNGLIEMGTFVAIILGQVLGAYLAVVSNHELMVSLVILGLSIIGYMFSLAIPMTPASDPSLTISKNPLKESLSLLKMVKKSKELWTSIIAISWFWFYGATLLAQFPIMAKSLFNGTETDFIVMLATFSLGVGVGSLLCEKLSKGVVEQGLVMLGGIGLLIFGLDLSIASSSLEALRAHATNEIHWLGSLDSVRVIADIALVGISGGIYIVPLYVNLQATSGKSIISRVIASNNIVNALFMVLSAGVSAILLHLGCSIPELIGITVAIHGIMLIYLCYTLPSFYTSFKSWISNLLIKERR